MLSESLIQVIWKIYSSTIDALNELLESDVSSLDP